MRTEGFIELVCDRGGCQEPPVYASGDKVDLLGMTFYASLAEEARYQLGRIDMPKAQDSIVNVWTDAEVTPNTGIEYVRDVNIVVANIESAIASITEG